MTRQSCIISVARRQLYRKSALMLNDWISQSTPLFQSNYFTQSAVVSSGPVGWIGLEFTVYWNLYFFFPLLYIAKFSEKHGRMSSLKCAKWNKARGGEQGLKGWTSWCRYSEKGPTCSCSDLKEQDRETCSIGRAIPAKQSVSQSGRIILPQRCHCVVGDFSFKLQKDLR